MPTISRGATIMSKWMENTGNENPYVEYFDEILVLCCSYNVPLTFIFSTRAGCTHDGFDKCQIYEAKFIRKLIKKAHKKGVSCIIDGLGHMNINQIPNAVKKIKKICLYVPLGVMGPVPTDRALGQEHVANAIGTAAAVRYGANYCQSCARTEHLGLPEIEDIPDAVGASVVATYIGDLGKYPERFQSLEDKMSRARAKNQWGIQLNTALEPFAARETFDRVGPKNKKGKGCSICGDLCPFIVQENNEGNQ